MKYVNSSLAEFSINDSNIIDLNESIKNLSYMQESAKINGVDTALVNLRKIIEFETKKQKVLQVHKNTITQLEVTKRGKKETCWQTVVGDKRPRHKSYEAMIEDLYNRYFGEDVLTDYSVKGIFNMALAEKERTQNPKKRTIQKNRADFVRFISSELGNKDVRRITEADIEGYIQDWVNDVHPKKKVFLAFKGVLNLIFDYAYKHKIIANNPLTFVKNKPYMKSCDTSTVKSEEKILSPEEIDSLVMEVRRRMSMKKYGSYYINGFALLFAIETGVRVGELCSIQWSDIGNGTIHIHTQQLSEDGENGTEYYLANYTKNEKGESEDGRYFPLTKKLEALLDEIKEKQKALNINSQFVFCHENGEWIKTDAYQTFLRRLCRSKGFNVTNNHALRMSLNSNVFIPMGISPADRAALLGHSIETNLKYYSFSQKNYFENARALLDAANEVGTYGTYNILPFDKKERSLQTAKSQASFN